jgi:ATP-dependent helicase/nuclease subunit B
MSTSDGAGSGPRSSPGTPSYSSAVRDPSRRLVAVVSPSAAVRLDEAERFLATLPQDAERLVVAPAREAADDFARGFAIGLGAAIGVHRASLVELVVKLASPVLAQRRLTPATGLGLDALASRIVARALAEGELTYLAPIAERPGFRRALLRTLREVRLAGLDPDDLEQAARTGPDLARLARRYDHELAGAGVADLPVLLRLAREALAAPPPVLVAERPVVLLDVPIHTRLDRDLLEALVAASGHVLMTVITGDLRTLAAVERTGGAVSAPAPRAETPAALSRVQRELFAEREDASSTGSTLGPDQGVEIFSAPGEGREAVEIARRLLHEAGRGVPFDRMAVLVRAPQVYASLLESALSRAGIPAWFAAGTRRPDRAGRAFLALLACAVEGLSANRFAEYLSLGEVPRPDGTTAPGWIAADDEVVPRAFSDAGEDDDAGAGARAETHDPPPDRPEAAASQPAPWKWERLVTDAAVIGGSDRWRRRLDGLAREIEVGIDELSRDDPDAPRVRAMRRDLADLDHLRAFALPIVDALARWPREATWGAWIERLEALAPRALAAPDRVLAVLAALRPMAALGPVTLADVRDVLADRLSDLRVRPRGSRFGRVFVGTPDGARGRAFDVVLVPGLGERVFPERVRQDPLLLDAAREQVEACRPGAGLPVAGDRLLDERLRLRLCAGAACERLHVSYASLDLASTRDRLPSLYALDLHRAVTGTIPDHETLARLAAAASGARLAWPAPPDPAVAIDVMEHDLAALAPLLHGRSPSRRGRARYLLEVSPALARSLRTRYARGRAPWTLADGVVLGEAERPMLAPFRVRARPYSVSALQRFATCPYQFYLASLLRLQPRATAAAMHTLDPLTRGRLVHEAIASCTRALMAAGAVPRSDAGLDRAFGVLDGALDEVAARYHDDLAPAVERIWRDEIAAIRADLRGWLSGVAGAGAHWQPAFVELGFGFPPGLGRDPASRPEPVTLGGGWLLHGVIDLVERRAGAGGLRVTDYKTGRNPVPAGTIVGRGTSLQPVLYGLAVEATLGDPVLESRLLFCTAAGRYTERSVPLSPDSAGARRAGLEVLEIVDRAIEQGFLPPAPRDGACARCEFVAVCGPNEERRAARKDRRPLADLDHLRSMR